MVLKQFVKFVPQVTTNTIIDFTLPNGGVLVSIKISWIPFTYFKKGTEDESIQFGDITAFIADSSTNISIIGQLTSPTVDVVVVSPNSDWDWEHQDADFLRSSNIIHKLKPNSGALPQGMINGSLRLALSPDPLVNVIHGVNIEAEVVSFDSNLT